MNSIVPISFNSSSGSTVPGCITPGQAAVGLSLTTGSGDSKVLYDTTENWNSKSTLVGKRGYIYIYSDWKIVDDQYISGFKVGDGNSYLIDLPFDNGVSSSFVLYDTTSGWNEKPETVAELGYIYVYTDAYTINGVIYPSFKIGDGNAYLIDLPLFNYAFYEHISNNEIHITQEEREFWNNKVTSYIDDNGVLILTKENI